MELQWYFSQKRMCVLLVFWELCCIDVAFPYSLVVFFFIFFYLRDILVSFLRHVSLVSPCRSFCHSSSYLLSMQAHVLKEKVSWCCPMKLCDVYFNSLPKLVVPTVFTTFCNLNWCISVWLCVCVHVAWMID